MKSLYIAVCAGLAAVLPATALAQQAPPAQQAPTAPPAPRRSTVVVPANESARPLGNAAEPNIEVTLTIEGAEAASFLTVKAANADVRDVFKEMGQRSGTTVLMAPSATGRVNVNVNREPLEKAMSTVASRAGLSVRRIVVPEVQAARLTPETAGLLSEALASMPSDAVITDPATGRSLALGEKAPLEPIAEGYIAAYYIQGKLTPEQERLARERRIVEQAVKTAQANQPNAIDPKRTDAVGAAVSVLGRLPVQQRMEALRNMQRQMYQSLTPQERAQLQNQERQNRQGRGRDNNRRR